MASENSLDEFRAKISDFKWQTLRGWGELVLLTKEEIKNGWAFLDSLAQNAGIDECECLFRGETLFGLGSRLSVAPEESTSLELGKIAARLFYFGEKSKHFWRDKLLKGGSKPILPSLDAISCEAIESILLQLRSALEGNKPVIEGFRKRNAEFIDELREPKELGLRICSLPDQCSIRLVRDVLAFSLHNLSSAEHPGHLVSTTPALGTAIQFATDRLKDSNHGVVIAFFLPKNWKNRSVRSKDEIATSERFVELGLPPFAPVFYSEHDEVAAFSAIFPSYIYSLVDLSQQTIVWNPQALQPEIRERRETWCSGLPIEQDDFEDRISRETSYIAAVQRDGESDVQIAIE